MAIVCNVRYVEGVYMQWLEYMASDNHDIVLMGDTHAGSRMTHYDGIEETVDTVASDKTIEAMFHMGDLIEAVTNDHPYWQMETIDPDCSLPYLQYEHLAKMFGPVGDKLKGVLYGLHDKRLFKVGNFVRDKFCKDLNAPYGTFASHVTVRSKKDGKPMFKIFLTHGAGQVKSTHSEPHGKSTNEGISLKKKLMNKFGDTALMAMGHTHKGIVFPPKSKLYLTCSQGKIKSNHTSSPQTATYIHPDDRWYANTGGYFKLYGHMGASSYAEEAMYDPIELSYIRVKVRDRMIVGADVVKV
jgi:predicted phosphodiesterase